MSLVQEKNVKTLARQMNIKTRKRDIITITRHVQWRLDRRTIVLKWVRFPEVLASHIMAYLGNECEVESDLEDVRIAHKRTIGLRKFRRTASLWTTFNDSLNFLVAMHSKSHPGIGSQSSLADTRMKQLRQELIDMASTLNPAPAFPWD